MAVRQDGLRRLRGRLLSKGLCIDLGYPLIRAAALTVAKVLGSSRSLEPIGRELSFRDGSLA